MSFKLFFGSLFLWICIYPIQVFPDSKINLAQKFDIKAAWEKLLNTYAEYPNDSLSNQSVLAIQDFKDEIKKLVLEYTHNAPADHAFNPKKLEKTLNNIIGLKSKNLKKGSLKSHQEEVRFEVGITNDQLLQIKYTMDIPCGTDSILFIFEPDEQHWQEVLMWESSDYTNSSGSLNALQYVTSPKTKEGTWYILGTDTPARCSSCWGAQRFYILQPIIGDIHPNVLFHRTETSYQCNEKAELKARENYFDFHFDGRSIQAETLIRPHQYRYTKKKDLFIRVQPVAKNSRDFIEEWIMSSWDEASQWCASPLCEEFKAMHQILHNPRLHEQNFQFESAKKIHGGHDRVDQISLSNYLDSKEKLSWNFLVKYNGAHNFTLLSINQVT